MSISQPVVDVAVVRDKLVNLARLGRALVVYFFVLTLHKLVVIAMGCWVNAVIRRARQKYIVQGTQISSQLSPQIPLRRLVFHDWSKFMWCEYLPYAKHFCGLAGPNDGFRVAFAHHCKFNDHHAEHHFTAESWTEQDRSRRGRFARAMPPVCVTEMVADMMAAEVSYCHRMPRPGRWSWIHANLFGPSVLGSLHPQSFGLLCELLQELGFSEDIAIARLKTDAPKQ